MVYLDQIKSFSEAKVKYSLELPLDGIRKTPIDQKCEIKCSFYYMSDFCFTKIKSRKIEIFTAYFEIFVIT